MGLFEVTSGYPELAVPVEEDMELQRPDHAMLF
jgi:hypothetical protein